jgi:deoxyuridine 5'-triphosphate nucleotidohydrolase
MVDMEQPNFLKAPKISFKKTHPDAQLPFRKRANDTGFDLFSVEDVIIPAKGDANIPTGITVAKVPMSVWFLILPRSGMGFKYGIQPHLGVIDNPYRGDLAVKLYNFSDQDYKVSKGDRIAQIAYFPLIVLESEWTEEVEDTDRGDKGFGNSGK